MKKIILEILAYALASVIRILNTKKKAHVDEKSLVDDIVVKCDEFVDAAKTASVNLITK